jgi:hypothetical protein
VPIFTRQNLESLNGDFFKPVLKSLGAIVGLPGLFQGVLGIRSPRIPSDA